MTAARIRIRSVKMKDGGATVRVLRNDRGARGATEFVTSCRTISERRGDDVAGYAVVAWGRDGGVSTAIYVSDGSSVPKMLVPEFVKTALLDNLISTKS